MSILLTSIYSTIFGSKIKTLLLLILTILSPVLLFYNLLIVFLSINLIVDYWLLIKNKKRFEKSHLIEYFKKIILYITMITMIFLFEKYILFTLIALSTLYLTTFVLSIIVLFELNKFLSNSAVLTNNVLFLTIKNKINEYVDKIFKKNK